MTRLKGPAFTHMRSRNKPAEIDLPKSDPRVKLLTARIKKEAYRQDALIEVLHTVQNAYGYLPMNILQFVAKELKLPPARVYSTVTFYHFFSLRSKGKHTCLVCTGTACYVKGAQQIINKIQEKFGLKPGEVTKDNELGLQVARCIGACGLAPAIVIDEEVQGKASADQIISTIESKLRTV